MKHSLFRLVTLVIMSLMFLSCGKSPSVLKNVKVEAQNQEGDVWMSFAADLNLGSMSFASISVPVLHPRGQTPIGQLDLTPSLGGTNLLKVSVNISALSDITPSSATLPNGGIVPLIANNQVISVDVGRGAKIYLALSNSTTAIGVAVPIGAFDNIGSKLPGLNLFPVLNISGVIATAGIFTGKNSGENGIAVVADVSNVINPKSLIQEAPVMMSLRSSPVESDEIKLNYNSLTISSSKQKSLDKMMLNLNKKKTILRMR